MICYNVPYHFLAKSTLLKTFMNNLQTTTDKVAISLSLLCAVHCLAFPVLLVLVPASAALPLNTEAFHYWMVCCVIPTSLYALNAGCKKHNISYVLVTGIFGLLVLIAAIVFSALGFGETLEKSLTVVGAAVIASVHLWNYKLCKSPKSDCECH